MIFIYGEQVEEGEIVDRGVFLSVAEFAPYRRRGWSGTKETNAAADMMIAEEDAAEDSQVDSILEPKP